MACIPVERCEDDDPGCPDWADSCSDARSYASAYCPLTCGRCSPDPPTRITQPFRMPPRHGPFPLAFASCIQPPSLPASPGSSFWRSQLPVNPHLKPHIKWGTGSGSGCADLDPSCGDWASGRLCARDPYVQANCRLSCRACRDPTSAVQLAAPLRLRPVVPASGSQPSPSPRSRTDSH